jgi:serine/threonine-protein kinase
MSSSNWIGKSVGGRYLIEDVLGQGGMSTVFKANDPNLRRVVAVKMIHPHMSSDQDFVRRFEEEATAVAQLRHPNIVQVFDFDHDGDTYYMVLEFVPGESLQERLFRLEQSGRQLSMEEVVKHSVEVCQAVDYAHQRGLIHRDLKPANVMLNVHGDAVLMDFGIAKIIGGQHHTATGAVIGTALYMSPEQIKGVEVDRRTDIYSLGVMLFEMVSGKPPFQADSAMSLMMMHVNDPVPDLRQLRPEIPQGLVAVIEKALSKDRNNRFQTAGEMAEALKNALNPISEVDYGGTVAVPDGESYRLSEQEEYDSPSATLKVQSNGEQGLSGETVVIPENTPRSTYTEQSEWGQTQAGHQNQVASNKRKIPSSIITGAVVGVIVLACLIIGRLIFVPRLLDSNDENGDPTESVAEVEPSATLEDVELPNNLVSEDEGNPGSEGENTPTVVDESTTTLAPTIIPTETPSPTIEQTPTLPTNYYAQIKNITNDGTYYVVDYETFGFQEVLPGTHLHFFFDTVPVEQAGVPGSGPWILYGGPSPFSQYQVADRPQAATMMCIRVANPDHSLYDPNSGNCFPLP